MIIKLFESNQLRNVVSLNVEPEYGYVTRMLYTDDGVRITKANDIGLNPGAAAEVAKDKAYTKHLLTLDGLTVPEGLDFLTAWWATKLQPYFERTGRTAIRTTEHIRQYIESSFGYPCFVKPVDGSQGTNVWCCRNTDELEEAIRILEENRVRVLIAEKAVALPDFRVVILHGEVISAYRRDALSITGDGRRTVSELMSGLQDHFAATGRDTTLQQTDRRIDRRLHHLGLTWDAIPAAGNRVQLLDVSNLSAGGTAAEFSDRIDARWKQVALRAAKAVGLEFCGVDLACEDIASPRGDYFILEVNAAPGLDHYGMVGDLQKKFVEDLYAKVLNVSPTARRSDSS